MNAHVVALEKARASYSTPIPGEDQEDKTYPVADLYSAAPDFWAAMTGHICDKVNPTWFGSEDCRLARADWRWVMAIMLQLGPGLGQWASYHDSAFLEADGALRIRATVGVHHGLAVYVKTLRGELARAPLKPGAREMLRKDLSGTYELDRDALVRERPYAPGQGSPAQARNLADHIRITVVLMPDGTWTRSMHSFIDDAMAGQQVKDRTSRGLWSVSGSKITFSPVRTGSGQLADEGDDDMRFFGVLMERGSIRLYMGGYPYDPGEYGWPLRREGSR